MCLGFPEYKQTILDSLRAYLKTEPGLTESKKEQIRTYIKRIEAEKEYYERSKTD